MTPGRNCARGLRAAPFFFRLKVPIVPGFRLTNYHREKTGFEQQMELFGRRRSRGSSAGSSSYLPHDQARSGLSCPFAQFPPSILLLSDRGIKLWLFRRLPRVCTALVRPRGQAPRGPRYPRGSTFSLCSPLWVPKSAPRRPGAVPQRPPTSFCGEGALWQPCAGREGVPRATTNGLFCGHRLPDPSAAAQVRPSIHGGCSCHRGPGELSTPRRFAGI